MNLMRCNESGFSKAKRHKKHCQHIYFPKIMEKQRCFLCFPLTHSLTQLHSISLSFTFDVLNWRILWIHFWICLAITTSENGNGVKTNKSAQHTEISLIKRIYWALITLSSFLCFMLLCMCVRVRICHICLSVLANNLVNSINFPQLN